MASSPGGPSTTPNSDAWSWVAGRPSSRPESAAQIPKAECEKLARFALSHAATAPRLQTRLEDRAALPGLRRVELIVENTGYLPTNITSVAADKKLAKPVEAR